MHGRRPSARLRLAARLGARRGFPSRSRSDCFLLVAARRAHRRAPAGARDPGCHPATDMRAVTWRKAVAVFHVVVVRRRIQQPE